MDDTTLYYANGPDDFDVEEVEIEESLVERTIRQCREMQDIRPLEELLK